jgi:hypothetical protein
MISSAGGEMSHPQAPAAATRPERRKSPRLPARNRILGTLLNMDRPVTIREIGFGGFATETVEPLPISELHDVQFTARDDKTAVLRAQSLYSWPSCLDDGSPCYVTGFEFRPEEPDEAQAIVRMLIEKVTAVGLYDDVSR